MILVAVSSALKADPEQTASTQTYRKLPDPAGYAKRFLRSFLGYWQTLLVYGMALVAAKSRLYDKKHYLSEVVLGGVIGSAVGYWVCSPHEAAAWFQNRPAKTPPITRSQHYGGI